MRRLITLAVVFCAGLVCAGELPKVLLIGDSIAMGYGPTVVKRLEGLCEVRQIPGNGGSTGNGIAKLESWLGDTKWAAIHFNWGLHDLKCTDAELAKQQVTPEQYAKNLEALLERLSKTGAKLIWCTTTPVPDGTQWRIVESERRYNEIAAEVLKKFPAVQVNDLWSYILPQRSTVGGIEKDVHYTPEGSVLLGNRVATAIELALELKRPCKQVERITNAKDIQAAIDRVSAAGGGEVILPKGEWRTTGITLKNDVTLVVEEGAVLIAVSDSKEYGAKRYPIVQAVNAVNVTVRGSGIIDGGGKFFHGEDGFPLDCPRPHYVMHWQHCKNLHVEGVTLRNSIAWTCKLSACDDVVLRNVKVRNGDLSKQMWADGIDPVCCRNVLIEKCDIQTADDGICIKSTLGRSIPREAHPPSYNIIIRDCTVASTCNAVKIGTETVGDISDVLAERIRVRRHGEVSGDNPIAEGECIAAISIQSNDGAHVRRITCRDFTVESCFAPVFVQLQDRDAHRLSDAGSISDITIERMNCKRALSPIQLNVASPLQMQNIVLRDITVCNQGNKEPREEAFRPFGAYPDAQRNGSMPAFGLFARDVKGLTLEGLKLTDEAATGKPAVALENIQDLTNTSEYQPTVLPPAPLRIAPGSERNRSPILLPGWKLLGTLSQKPVKDDRYKSLCMNDGQKLLKDLNAINAYTREISGATASQEDWRLCKKLARQLASDFCEKKYAQGCLTSRGSFKCGGVLQTNAQGKAEKILPAFYVVQNAVTFFDRVWETVKDSPVTLSIPDEGAAYLRRNTETGGMLAIYWNKNKESDSSFEWQPVDVTLKGYAFKDPVAIDLVTGRIYELPAKQWSMKEGVWTAKGMPFYDAPMAIGERTDFVKEKETLTF